MITGETMEKCNIPELVNNIINKMNFIQNREFYRTMRQRYASEEQYKEEFADFDEDMRAIWTAAKNSYTDNKEAIDKHLIKHDYAEQTLNNFKIINNIIEAELEKILLGD